MNDAKYIGLDVHQATITVAVRDFAGKIVMEAILETKAETLLQFLPGVRGSLHVTFEEGTWSAWLHDLLLPHVARVLVCDSRKNALLKAGNKNDRIDARKLSDLLYMNKLSAVYHGEQGMRTLKELARSYITMTRDLTMVDTFQPRSLSCFRIRERRHDNEMNLEKENVPRDSQHDMGWKAQRTFSLLPVAGEIVLLTFSFIERANLPIG